MGRWFSDPLLGCGGLRGGLLLVSDDLARLAACCSSSRGTYCEGKDAVRCGA